MITYRLVVEYDGTRYRGWQEQKNARTVAGALRRAIEATTGPIVELGGAGRTDAGVHALAQVAHLRVEEPVDAAGLRAAVNRALPADIHVLELAQAPLRFHARHAATSRAYLYQIARRRSALHTRFVGHVERRLDLDALRRAIVLLPGKHDFALFCDRPKHEKSTIVAVERAEFAESGALVLVRVEATHFLWRMVRRIVGALVRVGAGELSCAEFETLLAARPLPAERGAVAEWTVPASGLFLERVLYPGDPPLAALAPAVPVSAERA